MKNDIDGKLEKINTDILFYFLLVISSGISFYIINEKKRDILDRSNNSKDVLNKMYIFNRRLIVFVNIYFLINVYNSYKIIRFLSYSTVIFKWSKTSLVGNTPNGI